MYVGRLGCRSDPLAGIAASVASFLHSAALCIGRIEGRMVQLRKWLRATSLDGSVTVFGQIAVVAANHGVYPPK